MTQGDIPPILLPLFDKEVKELSSRGIAEKVNENEEALNFGQPNERQLDVVRRWLEDRQQ